MLLLKGIAAEFGDSRKIYDPEMVFPGYLLESADGHPGNMKRWIIENYGYEGIDSATLMEVLFERGSKLARMTIPSPQTDYVIDYDGKYKAYFAKDGGGEFAFERDFPNTNYFYISIPAYNFKTHELLVYMADAYADMILACKYENGELTLLSRMVLGRY